MGKLRTLELTDDGGLILRGLNGSSLRIEPSEVEDFGLITQEIARRIDLCDPDPTVVQELIEHLENLARKEVHANKDCIFPGQRMLASNTIIYRRR